MLQSLTYGLYTITINVCLVIKLSMNSPGIVYPTIDQGTVYFVNELSHLVNYEHSIFYDMLTVNQLNG